MKVNSYFKTGRPSNRTKHAISQYGLVVDPKHEYFDTVVCGVEVEVEKVGNTLLGLNGDVFQVKEDHSLRNNGREIITFPINSPLMMPAVQHIIKSLPSEHDFSLRTSIHFHFNVQDLVDTQLLNILYTYILFEKALYRFVHPSRKESIFCVPIQETDMYMYNVEWMELPRLWHKYSGLNLKPIQDIGTIEFRHLEGTNDLEKISNWFYICLGMYQFGAKYKNLLLPEVWKLNTTSEYIQFAHKVFGPWLECLDIKYLEADMAEGVKALKQMKRKTVVTDILSYRDSCLFVKLFGGEKKVSSKKSFIDSGAYAQLVAQHQQMMTHSHTFIVNTPTTAPQTTVIPQSFWETLEANSSQPTQEGEL